MTNRYLSRFKRGLFYHKNRCQKRMVQVQSRLAQNILHAVSGIDN